MRRQLETILEGLVLLGALATIPITVLEEMRPSLPFLGLANWTVWAIFLIEFLVMLGLSEGRLAYARRHWLHAAVVVLSFPALPSVLGLVRLTRFVRLLRFFRLLGITTRGLDALGTVLGRRGLVYVIGMTVILVLAGGVSLAILEPETVHQGFEDGFWWALQTVTTVGYGDITPKTAPGRLIALLLMLTGIGFSSTLSASVAAYFVARESEEDLRSLRKKLDRIEKLLQEALADRSS